jgi:hypothetical protein
MMYSVQRRGPEIGHRNIFPILTLSSLWDIEDEKFLDFSVTQLTTLP